MTEQVYTCFIESWDDQYIQCHIVEEETLRLFSKRQVESAGLGGYNLFQGYELHRGKEFKLTYRVSQGSIEVSCIPANTSRMEQMIGYASYKFSIWYKSQTTL